MTRILVEDELAEVLHSLNQPLEQTARDLMVLELYRRGTISSGKAADLLDVERFDFISRASKLGIPYFEMTEENWAAERAVSTER